MNGVGVGLEQNTQAKRGGANPGQVARIDQNTQGDPKKTSPCHGPLAQISNHDRYGYPLSRYRHPSRKT
jgi:hypothetical protein